MRYHHPSLQLGYFSFHPRTRCGIFFLLQLEVYHGIKKERKKSIDTFSKVEIVICLPSEADQLICLLYEKKLVVTVIVFILCYLNPELLKGSVKEFIIFILS